MLTPIHGGRLYTPDSMGVCGILIAGEKTVRLAPYTALPIDIPAAAIDAFLGRFRPTATPADSARFR